MQRLKNHTPHTGPAPAAMQATPSSDALHAAIAAFWAADAKMDAAKALPIPKGAGYEHPAVLAQEAAFAAESDVWMDAMGAVADLAPATLEDIRSKAAVMRRLVAYFSGNVDARIAAFIDQIAAVPVDGDGVDADLLAACAQFREAHDHYHHPTDPRWDEFTHQWHDTLDAILALPATTHAGVLARAEVARMALLVHLTEQDAEDGKLASAPPEGRLALSVLDDLVGGVRLSDWTAKQMPTGCWATPAAGQGDAS